MLGAKLGKTKKAYRYIEKCINIRVKEKGVRDVGSFRIISSDLHAFLKNKYKCRPKLARNAHKHTHIDVNVTHTHSPSMGR